MQATLGKAEFGWGDCGNIVSVLLPWEQVLAQLYAKFEDGDLSEWPLSLDVLCHIVRARLVRGPEDSLQKFKDLEVRSAIVKKLAEHLHRQACCGSQGSTWCSEDPWFAKMSNSS